MSKKQVNDKIQTLHPDPKKTNKVISKNKYDTIREVMLEILQNSEESHTDLMEKIYQRVKDTFEGGVQWYGETVKLDLEARGIIGRRKTKPERYYIIKH